MSIILQEIDKAKKSLPPLKINRNSSNVDKKPATPTSSSQSTPRDHQSKQNNDPASKTAASTRTDQSAARSTPTAAAAAAAPVMSNESVSAAATSTKTPSNQKSSAVEAKSQPNQAQAQSQQKACKSTTLVCGSFWSSNSKIPLMHLTFYVLFIMRCCIDLSVLSG